MTNISRQFSKSLLSDRFPIHREENPSTETYFLSSNFFFQYFDSLQNYFSCDVFIIKQHMFHSYLAIDVSLLSALTFTWCERKTWRSCRTEFRKKSEPSFDEGRGNCWTSLATRTCWLEPVSQWHETSRDQFSNRYHDSFFNFLSRKWIEGKKRYKFGKGNLFWKKK